MEAAGIIVAAAGPEPGQGKWNVLVLEDRQWCKWCEKCKHFIYEVDGGLLWGLVKG